MADFDVEFPDDLLGGLLNTEAGDICLEALNEAAPLLQESMKKAARAAVLHEGESDMVNSIAPAKAKRTKDGTACIVNVGPKGYSDHVYNRKGKGKRKRKEKVSNAAKAIWKEYGIAGKQAPRPFIANATRNAEQAVLDRLQETCNRKAGENNGLKQ